MIESKLTQKERFDQLVKQAKRERESLNILKQKDLFRYDLFYSIKLPKQTETTESNNFIDGIVKENPNLANTKNNDFEKVIKNTTKPK